MTDKSNTLLLPNGFTDFLIPDADTCWGANISLLSYFAGYGYNLIDPPLMEFADSVNSKSSIEDDKTTFKTIDVISNKTLKLRSDITKQVERIATSRLKNIPRPLRLMYSGEVVKLESKTTRPARGFKQFGLELVGNDSFKSDVEVISVAVKSLQNLGIKNLHLDLCLPKLAELCCNNQGVEFSEIKNSINSRDASAINTFFNGKDNIISELLSSIGSFTSSIKKLDEILNNTNLNLCDTSKLLIKRLILVARSLNNSLENINITIDVCENEGFNFQTGLGFIILTKDLSLELGRGGRYIIGSNCNESSVGFSLFSDTLLRVLPPLAKSIRIYAPPSSDDELISKLRLEGKVVICDIDDSVKTDSQEIEFAKKQLCTHIIKNNKIHELKG